MSTDYLTIRNWGVTSGALFSDDDVRSKRQVVVLGATVAKNLYPDTDPVGTDIRLGKSPFTVIGVLASKGQTASGADQDDVVLVPYTTAQTRLSGFSFLGQILASASDPKVLVEAQNEIRDIMRDAHGINGQPDDFTVRDQTSIAQAATSTSSVMTSLLAAIASVSLVVGGIGIMNIMLVSVTERTREIGIRMAIGARGGDVLTQFLVESVVMCLLGGIVGSPRARAVRRSSATSPVGRSPRLHQRYCSPSASRPRWESSSATTRHERRHRSIPFRRCASNRTNSRSFVASLLRMTS